MHNGNNYIILAILIFSGNAFSTPWSASSKSPIIAENIIEKKKSEHPFWDNHFEHGYYFYKKFVSPADGARCSMYPTCAAFGYHAIKKHGPIWGGWMATDRLMRDNGHHHQLYSLIEKFGKTRIFDPVENNDYWFTH